MGYRQAGPISHSLESAGNIISKRPTVEPVASPINSIQISV